MKHMIALIRPRKRITKPNYKHLLMLGALLTSVPILSSCSKPKYENSGSSFYSELSIKESSNSQFIPFENHQLHYVSIGNTNGKHVILIHGSPGSWDSFKYVLGNTKLQTQFNMAAIDRLHWGKSKPFEKLTLNEPDYKEQAAAVAEIIKNFAPNKNVILVGHSLGSSIAPIVAQEYPELVSGMLLISGSLYPDYGEPRWYNRVAKIWPISMLISDRMMQSNKEIMLLKDSLISTLPVWKSLNIPVTVIQGKKDRLVSPKNAEFIKQKLAYLGDDFRILELEKVGHFIPWQQTSVIRDELLLLAEKINKEI